mmetsp:Transcript_11789/g.33858  ORF Transcript_11789/g.33858 Transcript_11789/m.33858 type:complete len:337 (+) Transcript_11789:153-1163(+)|eukprot:CAMPEP_0172361724 /NCGR_PEP_ID=MMETSP1060-20121228/5501_1 /TAXON_ID=37318 /ORGANISM="Pseudo-nitzschia pungens, Strain cf. cingulata" /LENGTH=336 /DNA_ID=CAMNT_0013084081 /DNA_START=91 /DNA_END=1101 /DNA_ORIENTATION=+
MVSMNALYFMASTSPLADSGVDSNTMLFIPKWDGMESAPNDLVCFVGSATGLGSNILSANGGGGTDCTLPNGCGVHVHSGTDCATSATQGGHWYNAGVLTTDPWALIGYKNTSSDGFGQFASCVHTGFDVASSPDLLDGRAFVVHNEDGSRASCGIISAAPDGYKAKTLEATTIPIPGIETDATGFVKVITDLEDSVPDGVCYIGYAMGLEPNVESFLLGTGSDQCNAPNGCGAHIHSGTGCENKDEQGGHYYDSTELEVDPWKYESYLTTDSTGCAAMVGCTITGDEASKYKSRPFIIHEPNGDRLLCGKLKKASKKSKKAKKKKKEKVKSGKSA